MEAPSPPPEHQYFSQHTHDHWDLIEYLDWCKKQQLRDYGYEVTSSRWVKSLELIANNLEESQERRAKAQSLRDKYNLRCVSIAFCNSLSVRSYYTSFGDSDLVTSFICSSSY